MDISALQRRVIEFRDARNWQQFHEPKDCALSLVLEATEYLEHFQWKNGDELERYLAEHKDDAADELCDVLYWVLLIAHDQGINLTEAFERKMKKNEAKYPVDKSTGNHKKYTEL